MDNTIIFAFIGMEKSIKIQRVNVTVSKTSVEHSISIPHNLAVIDSFINM